MTLNNFIQRLVRPGMYDKLSRVIYHDITAEVRPSQRVFVASELASLLTCHSDISG